VHSSISAIRRCGVGLCQLTDSDCLSWGAYCVLPGIVQTVPRAELFALIVVIRFAARPLVIYTDSEWCFSRVNQPKKALAGTHADLWHIFFALAGPDVRVLWTKAHADTNPVFFDSYSLTTRCVIGNCIADALSGKAAKLAEVTLNDAARIVNTRALVKSIQLRLIAVLSALSPHDKHDCPTPPTAALSYFVLRSRHFVSTSGKYWYCTSCLTHCCGPSSDIRVWLLSACPAAPAQHIVFGLLRPEKVFLHPIVNGVALHLSHDLWVYRRVYFCRTCGAYACFGVGHLRSQCRGYMADSTYYFVLALLEGRRPGKIPAWPDALPARQIILTL
jgi:hypothetical protein